MFLLIIEKYFLPEHHFFTEYTFNVSDVPKSVLVTSILLNLLPFSWITNVSYELMKLMKIFIIVFNC